MMREARGMEQAEEWDSPLQRDGRQARRMGVERRGWDRLDTPEGSGRLEEKDRLKDATG
jgi:hypothetical protein